MKKDKLDRLISHARRYYTADELALGYLKYEVLRTLSPRAFANWNKRNLSGENFDDIVTDALLSWKDSE
jgi:hypothetical protein